jgi:hypothetical protein
MNIEIKNIPRIIIGLVLCISNMMGTNDFER